MTTEVIPTFAIQEIYSGNKFEGVAPDGDEEGSFRDRIQKWIGGSAGGEFLSPDRVGLRVEQVFWFLECSTPPDVEIYLVDDDGIEYHVNTATGSVSGSYIQRNGGLLVPPSFKLIVKTDQNIDALTSIVAEDTGVTGDGITATYDLQLVTGLIDPGSVVIVANTVTFIDSGADGILVGSGAGGGSGTVDYTTGEVEITLNTPADFNGVNALATYDYNHIGRVGIIVNTTGWGQPTFSQEPSLGSEERPPGLERAP